MAYKLKKFWSVEDLEKFIVEAGDTISELQLASHGMTTLLIYKAPVVVVDETATVKTCEPSAEDLDKVAEEAQMVEATSTEATSTEAPIQVRQVVTQKSEPAKEPTTEA